MADMATRKNPLAGLLKHESLKSPEAEPEDEPEDESKDDPTDTLFFNNGTE